LLVEERRRNDAENEGLYQELHRQIQELRGEIEILTKAP